MTPSRPDLFPQGMSSTSRSAAPPTQAALPEPDQAARERSGQLLARMAERIEAAGGWMDFAAYMQSALYEPGLGYYDGANRKFGAGGDFVTAPELSPHFARTLARHWAGACADLPAQVLEFGAGTGALAEEFLREVQRLGLPMPDYGILEVSADLRLRQQHRLSGLPVHWLDGLPASFSGLMIANEVLDVLPVRLFVDEHGVQERGVAWEQGRLVLRSRPAPADLSSAVSVLRDRNGPWPPGYGSEWCPLAGAWIHSLAQCLDRGLMLFFDYGFPEHEYYHPQRTMGTVMCHYRQHAHADPLWYPGLNDITAHVDFSACARQALVSGLQVRGYTSQANFLLNAGILDGLHGVSDPATLAGVQRLLLESEMGEIIKVMALSKGIGEAPLAGFTRGDRRHRLFD